MNSHYGDTVTTRGIVVDDKTHVVLYSRYFEARGRCVESEAQQRSTSLHRAGAAYIVGSAPATGAPPALSLAVDSV